MVAIADLHVHSAPSLLPRHGRDAEVVQRNRDAVGVGLQVLKAHEGSTAERAQLCGDGVVGGVVLNSPVGGANPDAVSVCCLLGGRVVWMPTVSSEAHQRAHECSELQVHQSLSFKTVPVLTDGRTRPEWDEVFEVVASFDAVLASGHLSCSETVAVFQRARALGVRRFLVNHPLMPFQGWDDDLIGELVELDAHLELGIVPDLLTAPRSALELVAVYPQTLFVFGSDTGHSSFPRLDQTFDEWSSALEKLTGRSTMESILGPQGADLVLL